MVEIEELDYNCNRKEPCRQTVQSFLLFLFYKKIVALNERFFKEEVNYTVFMSDIFNTKHDFPGTIVFHF